MECEQAEERPVEEQRRQTIQILERLCDIMRVPRVSLRHERERSGVYSTDSNLPILDVRAVISVLEQGIPSGRIIQALNSGDLSPSFE